MLLTNKTLRRIARFQRKIRKYWLARSQSVIYVFGQVMFKEAMLSTKYHGKTGDSVSFTPDKGSIREISMGEITDSIAPDDHLEGPYLLKNR